MVEHSVQFLHKNIKKYDFYGSNTLQKKVRGATKVTINGNGQNKLQEHSTTNYRLIGKTVSSFYIGNYFFKRSLVPNCLLCESGHVLTLWCCTQCFLLLLRYITCICLFEHRSLYTSTSMWTCKPTCFEMRSAGPEHLEQHGQRCSSPRFYSTALCFSPRVAWASRDSKRPKYTHKHMHTVKLTNKL